jgi:hypothetical protein
MEARHIISALTDCGVLDAGEFIRLVDDYGLDIYFIVDEVRDMGVERIGLNDLIYVALKTITEYFLKSVVHAKRARHFKSTEYQIFTNYLDSSAWFYDENLQRCFQQWHCTRKKTLT